MADIIIPAILRPMTSGADSVQSDGATVIAIIDDLDARFPDIKKRLCDDSGNIHRFVNIYVNGEDIRFLNQLETPVQDSDEVTIVPAIAGG